MEINETHITLLSKEKNLLSVDYKELKFEFEDSFEELRRMSENDNRNICELETFIQNNPLECLLNSFNFCEHLGWPWQALPKYKLTNYSTYQNELSILKKNINDEVDFIKKNELELKFDTYVKNRREEVYQSMKIRRIAFMLDKEYTKCQKDTEVLAFSHRKIGYTYPEFKLGADFDVIYNSNFGFGNASFFFTNIRYKGIDILPYSDWIRYRYVQKSEIIRYTRRHLLENSSWVETMDFTAEVYNHSITNPTTFVEKWIMNECREMVDGLEYLLNKDDHFEIINSFFNNQKYNLIGYELLNLKGERISGALYFLEKISKLKEISSQVDGLITRILKCNLNIYHQLKSEIISLLSVIAELQEEIESIKPEWSDLRSVIEDYKIKRRDITSEISRSHSSLTHSIIIEKANELFQSKYPEFNAFKEKFEPIDSKYNELNKRLDEKESWKKTFLGYNSIIKKHFKESGDQNIDLMQSA